LIIEKLTFTPGKTVLQFREDADDPELRTLTCKMLPELLQSHVDAIGDHIVRTKREAYQEAITAEKKQLKLLDEDGGPVQYNKEDDEESEGYTAEQAEADGIPTEEDEEGWEGYEVPTHPGTDIVDIRSMEIEHAVWYVENHYTDSDFFNGSPDKAIAELQQDMKYNGFTGLESCKTLKDAIERSIKLIKDQ
jgi:hypothetical protein